MVLKRSFTGKMKLNSIINRYIFTELLPPFIISLLFFSFVFLLRTILEITNFVVNYGVSLHTVSLFLVYSLPYFLQFVIPMSVMIAVLLTFLRMSSDNEIVALKAGGMNIYVLILPVFLFCLMGCLLTGFTTIYGLPWGKLSFKKLTFEVAARHLDIGLKEKTFNNDFKDVILFINRIDLKTRAIEDVFIEDQRSKEAVITVVAPKGRLYSEPDKMTFFLRLYNGIINQVDKKNKSVHSIKFDTYDISLDLEKSIPSASTVENMPKRKGEMSLSELKKVLKEKAVEKDAKYYRYLLKFHEKFSLPFACFAMGLLGLPMGLRSKSGKQSLGLVMSIFLFLFYYIMYLLGASLGETGAYPPVVGMWVPNIVMGGIGLYLLIRMASDQPLLPDFLNR